MDIYLQGLVVLVAIALGVRTKGMTVGMWGAVEITSNPYGDAYFPRGNVGVRAIAPPAIGQPVMLTAVPDDQETGFQSASRAMVWPTPRVRFTATSKSTAPESTKLISVATASTSAEV